MNIFHFNKKKSTKVFVPDDKGVFVEHIIPMEECDSINAIAKHFGYTSTMFVKYQSRNSYQDNIKTILHEIFTNKIICIITNPQLLDVSHKMVSEFMEYFDQDLVYSNQNIATLLSKGIEESSLSIEFLSRTLAISNTKSDGIFHVPKLNLKLHFVKGTLVKFEWDDLLAPPARDLKQTNRKLFANLSNYAAVYWKDNYEKIYKEVNKQCAALYNIPESLLNPYIRLHQTENGAVNFHMLLVCHYSQHINLTEFEELNHGRYIKIPVSGNYFIKCKLNNFYYYFNHYGHLIRYSIALKQENYFS